MNAPTARRQSPVWLRGEDCDIADFRALVEVGTELADYPHADAVERGVLIYGERLRAELASGADLRDVKAELVHALMDGPGIAVFKGAYQDTTVIDRATAAFNELIDEQKAAGVAGGDHFAPPGRTIGCGTRWRSWLCTVPRFSPTTTPTTSSPSRPQPGSVRTIR